MKLWLFRLYVWLREKVVGEKYSRKMSHESWSKLGSLSTGFPGWQLRPDVRSPYSVMKEFEDGVPGLSSFDSDLYRIADVWSQVARGSFYYRVYDTTYGEYPHRYCAVFWFQFKSDAKRFQFWFGGTACWERDYSTERRKLRATAVREG